MGNVLSDETQRALREEKIITAHEIAIAIGDKFIAENILTKSRREVYVPQRLIESTSNKRILKG